MKTADDTWSPPICLLGVPFDNITTQQTLARITGMVDSRRPHFLATANVDFTVQAMHDLELRRILSDAHLVLCDGQPLVWASKILGNALPERVAGSDLAPLLLSLAEQRGWRVFFLGGEESVAAKAVENVRAKHPHLKIVGVLSPPFKPLLEMDHDAICRTVREANADLLFVSFGCPKQEKWISMNYRNLGVPVSIGVGATIDFLAGTMKRAPKWMQRSGLEWTWRLAQEPRRLFKRYFTDLFVFGGGIVRQIFGLKKRKCDGDTQLHIVQTSSNQIVDLPVDFSASAVRALRSTWDHLLQGRKPAVLNGSAVTHADSTGVAMLLRLETDLRQNGLPLVIAAPSLAMKRALKLMNLDGWLTCVTTIEEALRISAHRREEESTCDVPQITDESCALRWTGEVTASNVQEVWAATEVALASAEQHGNAAVDIDLSTLRFVDSSGVGLMVRAKKIGTARGLAVRFTRPTDVARSVIRTLRMENFLFGEPSNLAVS